MNRLFIGLFLLIVAFVFGFKVSNPSLAFYIPNTVQQSDLSSTEPVFRDVTETSGLPKIPSSGIGFGDYDNDGWVDMLAAGRLFRNVSTRDRILFTDMTAALGLGTMKGQTLFADIDNNGYLDIVTSSGQIFLQLQKDHFVESFKLLGFSLPEGVHTLSTVDVNGDGWVDILVGMKELSLTSFLPPQVYINQWGKKVSKWTSFALDSHPNYVRGIAVADYNNDGIKEAYFSNYRIRPNNLFRLGHIIFNDQAAALKIQGTYDPKRFLDPTTKKYYGPRYGHTISSVWADLDNDGNLDLWASNLVHKFAGVNSSSKFDSRGYLCDDSKIYKNMGPPFYNFVDVRPSSGIAYKPIGDYSKFIGDELWAHTTIADFDNDGLQDVYVSQVYDLDYAYSLLFKNKGGFKFQDVSKEQGTRVFDSYAAAWADLNNDGKMDLVQSGRIANKQDPTTRVLQNVMSDGNNYLKVKLKGGRSGTQAITAQVRVFHRDGLVLRQQEGVVGTMSQQNDPTLHFGLGKIQQIDKIEVKWPTGRTQTIKSARVNQTIVIEEKR